MSFVTPLLILWGSSACGGGTGAGAPAEAPAGSIAYRVGGDLHERPPDTYPVRLQRTLERTEFNARAHGRPDESGFRVQCTEEFRPSAWGNDYSLRCDWGPYDELAVLGRRQAELVVRFTCGQMGRARLQMFRADLENEGEEPTEIYVLAPVRPFEAPDSKFPLAQGPSHFVLGGPGHEVSGDATTSGRLFNRLFEESDHYTIWVEEQHPHYGAVLSSLGLVAEFYERRKGRVGGCRSSGG